MNPFLAVTILMVLAGAMFMLPLVPALVELHRKSDAQPLSVIQEHAGEIRYFAKGFRARIAGLQESLQQCVASGAAASGTFSVEDECLMLGRADEPLLLPFLGKGTACPFVIAAGADLTLPRATTLAKELYVAGRFTGKEEIRYRAIYGEKEVHLGPASSVARWAHAAGEFSVERGCTLYGRISSDHVIRLQEDCVFLRLNAPRIELGTNRAEHQVHPEDSAFTDSYSEVTRRVYDGDLEIPGGELIVGNIVARGKLHIGAGALIRGSVKSSRDMVLESGVCVQGSLISARRMRIGAGCSIHGPVLAERQMVVATGTYLGAQQRPTSVSAPQVLVEEGVVVFGTLWAREHGEVVAL